MSQMQEEDGGYGSWGSINSESCAQIITACAALGINPDTDPRFIKNGSSVVDAILKFYNPETKMFRHLHGQYGGGEDTGNAMATEQACYALAAYQRLVNGQNSLYDMTDVQPSVPDVPEYPGQDLEGLVAYLNMTEKVSNKPGTEFPVKVDIQGWDNAGKYKLMDCIMTIPEPLEVESVVLDDSRFAVGTLNWNVDSEGNLRVVYADLEKNADLVKTGEDEIVPFFTVNMKVSEKANVDNEYNVTLGVNGMTVKLNADSFDEGSQIIADIQYAKDTIILEKEGSDPGPGGDYTGTRPGTGFSFTTGILYKGDNVDLIPENKMAVCVQIINLSQKAKLTFKQPDGEVITFRYNQQVSDAAHVNSYVALLDSSIDMEIFKDASSYTLMFDQADIADCALNFGDTNEDNVVNAQDALAVVNAWLRKTETVTDLDILHMNINSDSRVNTYDALGIVENFVNGHQFAIVDKATTIRSRVQ